MPAERRRLSEQEQSIKEREYEVYIKPERPEPEALSPVKPFAAYLRETPASPLSAAAKTTLWTLGVVVLILLVLALWRVSRPRRAQPDTAPPPARTAPLE
jgi:hypothetical protein